jgi:hypothetical protein
MKAPEQNSFAKGFNGEEDNIKGQDMPENEGAAETKAEGGIEEPGEAGAPAVVVAIGAPAAGSDPEDDPLKGGDSGKDEAAEGEPPMSQSEKSWNGRLTAREKELKAKADALDARSAEIESQKMPTYDEAVSSLTGDFGEDFVKLIQVVAQGATKGEVETSTADLRDKIDGITEGVKGAFGQLHKEMISSVHDDFEQVAGSEEFRAYIESLPEAEKAKAMQVIEQGTAREIVNLLTAFKKTLTTEGNDNARYDSAALDAAAGVRSAGGRAPSLGGDTKAAGGEVDRFRAGFNA